MQRQSELLLDIARYPLRRSKLSLVENHCHKLTATLITGHCIVLVWLYVDSAFLSSRAREVIYLICDSLLCKLYGRSRLGIQR